MTSLRATNAQTDATRSDAPQNRRLRYDDSDLATSAARETSVPSHPRSWLESHAEAEPKSISRATGTEPWPAKITTTPKAIRTPPIARARRSKVMRGR
jgi:hypothetical protein